MTETFINLTATKASARHVTGILLNQSGLARTKAGATIADPTAVHGDPAAGKGIWEDDTASTKVTAAVIDSDALTGAGDFGDEPSGTGMFLPGHADLFNLLCIPPDTFAGDLPTALYATARRTASSVEPYLWWTPSVPGPRWQP